MSSTSTLCKAKLTITIINDLSSKIDKSYYLSLTKEEKKENIEWTRITSESKKRNIFHPYKALIKNWTNLPTRPANKIP